jgi:hypothetical protein
MVSQCPNACSFNGECDISAGLCSCNEFFGGDDCSVPRFLDDPTKLAGSSVEGFGSSALSTTARGFSLSKFVQFDGVSEAEDDVIAGEGNVSSALAPPFLLLSAAALLASVAGAQW